MSDTRQMPLVYVLLATFNGDAFIQEQLDSIAAQTHTNWKLIVADDSSTDRTVELVDAFARDHPGKVEVSATSAVGSAKANFFRLLRTAPDADYVALCDQDDVWIPQKLDRLIHECAATEAAEGAETAIAVYSDLRVTDQSLNSLADSFMHEVKTDPARVTFGQLLLENSVPGCSMLLNRSLVRIFRQYEGPVDAVLMHDWWLALVAAGTGELRYVPDQLVLYRQHADNAAGSVHRGGVSFIITKLMALRQDPPATLAQAVLLSEAYGGMLARQSAETLRAYCTFTRVGKIRRILRCFRYGILKQTVSRRIYQLAQI